MGILTVGASQQQFFEVFVCESVATEVGNQQRGDSGGHRTGLRSALHLGISAAAYRAIDYSVRIAVGTVIAARCTDIYPVSIIRVSR